MPPRGHVVAPFCHSPLIRSEPSPGPTCHVCLQVHNAMFAFDKKGEVDWRFQGSDLLDGETDGSSFQNGGLRVTHTAGGYTRLDPSSPIYSTPCLPAAHLPSCPLTPTRTHVTSPSPNRLTTVVQSEVTRSSSLPPSSPSTAMLSMRRHRCSERCRCLLTRLDHASRCSDSTFCSNLHSVFLALFG